MIRILLALIMGLVLTEAAAPRGELTPSDYIATSTFFDNEVLRYCHSYCTLSGSYYLSRLWEEADSIFVDETDLFEWSYDGNTEDFWLDGCAETIDSYKYAGFAVPLLETLKECRPVWIYTEQVELLYERGAGRLSWIYRTAHAYQPTEDAWNRWADVASAARSSGNILNNGDYDAFDGLLRFFPEVDDQPISTDFVDAFYYKETYIANYEPNFCSMQMSRNFVDLKTWCSGTPISDSNNDIDYPTQNFCENRDALYQGFFQSKFEDCTDSDDDCETVKFLTIEDLKREAVRKTKPSTLHRLMLAAGSPKKLAKYEKRLPFYQQEHVAYHYFPYCALKA